MGLNEDPSGSPVVATEIALIVRTSEMFLPVKSLPRNIPDLSPYCLHRGPQDGLNCYGNMALACGVQLTNGRVMCWLRGRAKLMEA